MLDHAREAVKMAEGKERTALRNDRILELALIRLIEIVGEAAVKVSPMGRQGLVVRRGLKLSQCETV
jgi:uncharacterized protein with HEPN domain